MQNGVSREVIDACRRGDARAQKLLFDALHGRLMNVCLRYTRDEEEARSHFVKGLARVFLNLDRYQHEGSFEAWAARVVINTTLNALRDRKRYSKHERLTEPDEMPTRSAATNDFELRADADDVLALVRKLPNATRDVFMLFAVDGFTHHDIAGLLGISEGTSKWHVSDARKRLMAMIADSHKSVRNNETQR